MASSSYFLCLTLITVVILSALITVLADEGEGPLAKRRRLSIRRLKNNGRLRRLYKKSYEDPPNSFDGSRYVPETEEVAFDPEDILELLDELEALDRLRGSSAGYEKRGKKYNGWNTGMFGKRSSPASENVRESRNFPQILLSDDYFRKRFNNDDAAAGFANLGWKRAFELPDVTEEDME